MKLSIITINLNNASGLSKTIASITNQTFNDFEFIIIDGASKDDSLGIINDNKSKINFLLSEPDTGVYNAMNKGIRIATGEYCLFLNSGDYLCDCNVLKNVFNFPFDEHLVIGSVILDGRGKKELFEIPDIGKLTFRYFINLTLPHPGTFIKRSLFSKLGYFNEGNIISSDLEFFLVAIFKNGATLRKIQETVSVFDWNGMSSLPENSTLVMNERTAILQKHFPMFLSDYEYLEYLEIRNKELEFKIKRSIWTIVANVIRKAKIMRLR